LKGVQTLAQNWLSELDQGGFSRNPLTAANGPKLVLKRMIH